jgi:adenylylsulfate kinase
MMTRNVNIFPDIQITVNRKDKEQFLQQHSIVIWMTGLSGAGKTTIAKNLEAELLAQGYMAQILDGDNIRSGINNNLSFSEADRFENIRRIAEISKLFVQGGIICINSFISPTGKIRDMAKKIIGKDDYIEIYVNAPLEVCEDRDVKGLYSKARSGEIKDFTGIDSPFEEPISPDVEVNTDIQTAKESVQQILDHILPLIEFKKDKN